MSAASYPSKLAKITWQDPQSGATQEYVLTENATASIGRLETNDICIREQHVSRQHAVISSRDGAFVISDLGSANGVFVNDQRVEEPVSLQSGDAIRLFVPVLHFSQVVSDEDRRDAAEQGTLITAIPSTGKGRLIITNGPQEGSVIPLLLQSVTVGRAVNKAEWEICLQDVAVSRPHARLELVDHDWLITDLESANGTLVNGAAIRGRGRALRDGDVITFGTTFALFRGG